MAKSLVYISLAQSLANGRINFDKDKFRMLLVNSSYTNLPDATKRQHQTRSDVTFGETYGFNYTRSNSATIPGPGQVFPLVEPIQEGNRIMEVSFVITSWTNASFVTTGGIIYKFVNGTDGGDDLVGYVDFGQIFSFSNQTCAVPMSKNLRFEV